MPHEEWEEILESSKWGTNRTAGYDRTEDDFLWRQRRAFWDYNAGLRKSCAICDEVEQGVDAGGRIDWNCCSFYISLYPFMADYDPIAGDWYVEEKVTKRG